MGSTLLAAWELGKSVRANCVIDVEVPRMIPATDRRTSLTNLSTSHLIRPIRLHRAKSLLQTSQCNVSEMTSKVGVLNASYFF